MTTATVIDRIKTAGIVGATSATTAIAAPSAVFGQGTTPGGNAANCASGQGSIREGLECATATSTANRRGLFENGGIFDTVISTMLFIVGAISVIMLIIGGIRYLVSAGDQNAVTGAKITILYAIVGIVISFLAYGAVQFVVNALESS